MVTAMTWLIVNDHGFVPFVVDTIMSFRHSWLIIGSLGL